VKLINFSRRYKDTFGTSADQERIASLEKHMMQMSKNVDTLVS
jgi:hypothetical protein